MSKDAFHTVKPRFVYALGHEPIALGGDTDQPGAAAQPELLHCGEAMPLHRQNFQA
jgi:hypothetical protein